MGHGWWTVSWAVLWFTAAWLVGMLGWIALRLYSVRVVHAHQYTRWGLTSKNGELAGRERQEQEEQELDSQRDAVFAGSFDPVHSGHVALLTAIARRHRHGTVYLVIGRNPRKTYKVSPEARCELLRAVCRANPKELGNVRPLVMTDYIWRLAYLGKQSVHTSPAGVASCLRHWWQALAEGPTGAAVMYRGIRSWEKDGGHERVLLVLNCLGPLLVAAKNPPVTCFLCAPPSGFLSTISSTEVRRRARSNESLDQHIPAEIEAQVRALYGGHADAPPESQHMKSS
eukprot:g56926.t1